MSNFTSKADGSYETTGQVTWNEVGKPASGDVITSFAHNITVDANETVGPGTGTAITPASGLTAKTLTVSPGFTLTVKGDITFLSNVVYVVVGAGSTLKFLPNSGVTNKFDIQTYLGHLALSGSSGSRAILTTDKSAGGANSIINAAGRSGLVAASYADISNFGTATTYGVQTSAYQIDGYDVAFSQTNCTLTGCNQVVGTDSSYDFDFTYTGNVFSNSVAQTSAVGGFSFCASFALGGAGSTGTWIIDGNGFDLDVALNTYRARAAFTNNVVAGKIYLPNGSWSSDAKFSGNFIGDAQTQATQGPVKDLFLINPTASNPHFLSGATSVDGAILDYDGVGGDGDGIFPAVVDSGLLVQRCLVLESAGAAGQAAANLISALGLTANDLTVLHNTIVGAGEGGMVHLGENLASYTGIVAECNSNLVARLNSGVTTFVLGDTGTPAVDNVVQALCNGFLNANSGTNFYNTSTSQSVLGYLGVKLSANTPYPNVQVATGDVAISSNPFVDSTMRLKTWGTTQGADGTVAGAIAKLVSQPALLSQATTGLFAKMKSSYAVTAASLKDAGEDGVTIGAMGFFVAGAATTYTINLRRSTPVNVAVSVSLQPNGTADGVTFTLATNGTGTFADSTLAGSGSDELTTTYTPTDFADSPHTISVTNDGGLTDPASVELVVTEFADPLGIQTLFGGIFGDLEYVVAKGRTT